MMNKSHYRIPVENKQTVHGMHTSLNSNSEYLVIFSHGFTAPGFESRRMFLDLSNRIVNQNIDTLLFDYRGSGYSDMEFEFMTADTEISDMQHVIDWAKSNIAKSKKIILWGQSFGAGITLWTAAVRQDLFCCITWCLSANWYERYLKRLGQKILDDGYVYLDKGFKLNKSFLISLKDKNIIERCAQIECPVLLVHGTEDPVANVNLSRNAYSNIRTKSQLTEIEGGIHGFKLQPELYEEAVKKTIDWLHKIVI